MIFNLKTKLLYLFPFWLISGCASIENVTEKKPADRNVLVGWENAATSTIYRLSDQAQNFVTWYYRFEPGKVKVLACQAIFSAISQPSRCSVGEFPKGGPEITTLTWVPSLNNGSQGGPMAWISFYRRDSESIKFTAREQIVCAIAWADDKVSCAPVSTPLDQ